MGKKNLRRLEDSQLSKSSRDNWPSTSAISIYSQFTQLQNTMYPATSLGRLFARYIYCFNPALGAKHLKINVEIPEVNVRRIKSS